MLGLTLVTACVKHHLVSRISTHADSSRSSALLQTTTCPCVTYTLSNNLTCEVVPVDGEVKPHELSELVVAVAQHVGEVVGPVQVGVDGPDAAALAIQVAVDLSSDAGQLGNQVHGVFIDKLGEQEKRDLDTFLTFFIYGDCSILFSF